MSSLALLLLTTLAKHPNAQVDVTPLKPGGSRTAFAQTVEGLVRQKGGSLELGISLKDDQHRQWQIDLSRTRVTDTELAALMRMIVAKSVRFDTPNGPVRVDGLWLDNNGEGDRVHSIDLSKTDIGDDGIAEVARLNGLGRLDVSYTSISSFGVQLLLKNQLQIRSLGINGLKIDRPGLKAIAEMKFLFQLSMKHCVFEVSPWDHLAKLDSLEHIDASYVYVPTHFLGKHLWKNRKLTSLNLAATNISDDSLLSLMSVESLRNLSIANTSVTNKGMEKLAAIKGLRYVDVTGTAVDEQGIATLRGAFPMIEVRR